MSAARTAVSLARRSALLAQANAQQLSSINSRPLTSASSSSPGPSVSSLSSSIFLSTSIAAKGPAAAAAEGGAVPVESGQSGHLRAVAMQQHDAIRRKRLAELKEKEDAAALGKSVEASDPAAY